MASFQSLFPTFLQRCADLRNVLMVVPYMLVITGIVMTAMRRPSVRGWTRYFIRVPVVLALLSFLPQWGDQVQQIVAGTVTNTLQADPNQVYQAYQNALAVKQSQTQPHGMWDLIAGGTSHIVNAIIAGVLWLIAFAASLLLFWAYIFQKIILNTGYGLSPILIGFMAVPALTGTGYRFLIHLTGVLLWPLGWGVAALISQGIIDFMTDQSFLTLDPTSVLYSMQNLLGLAVLAFWTIFSTIAAPVIIQRVLSDGITGGAELLHAAHTSLTHTAGTAASAAGAALVAGLPAARVVAAAATAGALTGISSSAGVGNAGSFILAGNGVPLSLFRRNAGDDLTGDRAVRELLAKSRKQ